MAIPRVTGGSVGFAQSEASGEWCKDGVSILRGRDWTKRESQIYCV